MLDQNVVAWGPVIAFLPSIAFLADWWLTVVGARLARKVSDQWSVEGSYELNPTWSAAIDRGEWINARVVLVAVLLAVLMAALWLLAPELDGRIFALAAGALLLVQAPTLMNHVSNIVLFRSLADPSAATGGLQVSRGVALEQAAWLFFRFAVLWLVLAIVSLQAFFLGGVIGCSVLGVRFWRLSRMARQPSGP